MAATYTLPLSLISFSANKVMACVYNGSGSGKVLKIRRVWILNNQLVAVTGVLTNIELRKITAASGGTTLAVTKHDSASAALPAQVITGTNQTVTFDGIKIYKRIIWSTDEPSNASGTSNVTLDELEIIPAFCCVWTLGYGDSTLEKLTLREGEGLAIVNTGANAGTCDIFIELTAE